MSLVKRIHSDERGILIPIVMLMLMLVLIIVVAAMQQAGFAESQSNRDRNVKRAIEAADAGVNAALDSMNRLNVMKGISDVTTQPVPCVTVNGSGSGSTNSFNYTLQASASTTAWCPAVTGGPGGDVSYSYRVSPVVQVSGSQVTYVRTIVSTGTAGDVTRRVASTITALVGTPLIGNNGLVSLKDITLANSNSVTGNVRTNGGITLNNSSQIACVDPVNKAGGDATPGPGKTVTKSVNSSICGSTASATSPITLAPVDQGNSETTNDNGRICGLDVCAGHGVSYNSTTRWLTLSNLSSLTLGGSVYNFCELDLNNHTQLIIPPLPSGQQSVRIYIDSPQNCGGSGGNFTMGQSATIINQNTTPTSLQIYMVGSSTTATNVTFSNNTGTSTPIVIYAPQSTVTLSNSAKILGAIATQQITMNNSASITYDQSVGSLMTNGLFPLYGRTNYVECTINPTGSAPDSGCGDTTR